VLQKPQALSLSNRFSHVLSTPNLRADNSTERKRALRRSYSAASMGLPRASPLSPLRLPSLTSNDKDGRPWSETMHESLRLSQFPVPPRHRSLKPSETDAHIPDDTKAHGETTPHSTREQPGMASRAVEIRVQQPTSVAATPRASTSIRGILRENTHPAHAEVNERGDTDEGDSASRRSSVHLYSMRISHHLRSGSLLSWDQLADAPDPPTPPRPFRDRTISDQSRYSNIQSQLARHQRQTSSSGFASSKVPSKWGKVLPNERDLRGDVASISSIYSSKPQSPPDSHTGSMINLSQVGSGYNALSSSSLDFKTPRRSSSFPTDNEETPRPAQRYDVTNLAAAQNSTAQTLLLEASSPLARMNSVADTKKSKFREEFSPSPPRKKLTPSNSIMKFLNPKRLSMRSQSEASLQANVTPELAMDGAADTLGVPDRERRQSRSMVSLQAEQESLGKNKGANHVWDSALKAHQEEKAALFLPQNRELAVHASPHRERRGSSVGRQSSVFRRTSFQEDVSPSAEATTPSAPHLKPLVCGEDEPDYFPSLAMRRRATAGRDDVSLGEEIAEAFEKQGDSPAIVSAWGRYPSHTRSERTFSAGKADLVESRDFALEAAVRFASTIDNEYDEDMIDPTDRAPSPPLLPGEKKRKKRVGTGKIMKSNSMTFGRKLIKNYYSGMFKSSSSEFRRHGRGHRSSIVSGGTLEHPELELLPDVFTSAAMDGAVGDSLSPNGKHVLRRHSERNSAANGSGNGKGKLPTADSMATLRPRRNSSAPNFKDFAVSRDSAQDSQPAQDRARVWSVYYETCVPSFPRLSTDGNFGLDDFGGPSRLSFDSKRASMHSRTLPPHIPRHSRNASQGSRLSSMSRRSEDPSVLPVVDDATASEEKSLVSVRRSTMDLMAKYKEQEVAEHDRVLSLTRAESYRGETVL
jgi:hypothetical protein